MIESVDVTKDYKLTDEQLNMIHSAQKKKIVYDEDSPEFTEDMLALLIAGADEKKQLSGLAG